MTNAAAPKYAPMRGRFFGEGVDGFVERLATTDCVLSQYLVVADRATGEWLTVKALGWKVSAAKWAKQEDTATFAFNTAEIDGRTVAIQIEWQD